MKQLYIIILLAVWTLSGCTKDEMTDTGDPGFDGQTVVFSLVSSDQHISRATTPGEESLNENLVERLDVFFFSQTGECLFYPSESQMEKVDATIKIKVPAAIADMLYDENIRLYVVANSNLSRDVLGGKSYRQLIETVHGVSQDYNPYPFKAQTSFLMDGILSIGNLTVDRTDLGEVSLSRAASKINVQIVGASVDGYTPVEAHVRIDNYLELTSLGQEAPLYKAQKSEYHDSEYRPIWIPNTSNEFNTAPFYSYANDWEFGDSPESYITIRVKWYKDEGGSEPKNYYYRIPFNYIRPSSGDDEIFSLKRNYIYTLKVNIGALGGLDPDEMLELKPDFEVKDWTTNRIVARLEQYDYLVVAETEVEMHDITSKSIHYISSQPVSVEMQSVFHFTYLSSGEIQTTEIPVGDDRYPSVVVNEATTNIDITSPVPVNYVPVMMFFRVKNAKGLYHDISVIQYPRQYITSKFSDKGDIDFQWYKEQGRDLFWSNNGDGGDGMTNFNLYTVTTASVAPGDNFVIGGDFVHDEKSDADLGRIIPVTKQDEATNNMVSPQFVIASQRGITSTSTSYSGAQVRCAYYMEGTFDRGTWRIPTLAEMELISKLQRDGNSAIKELFKPANSGDGRWWSARIDGKPGYSDSYYYSVKVMTGEVVRQQYVAGSTTASVRCVRDVWKN